MIKLAGVASQVRFDLAQAARPAKLTKQHRDQMCLGLNGAIVPVGIVLFHKPVERRPRNLLQKFIKNDILLPHGVDPLRVQMIRNQLNLSRINAVHFLKQKSCRTPVGLTRQSISLRRNSFGMDARVKPAHDEWKTRPVLPLLPSAG
jgi:hypothetical protein